MITIENPKPDIYAALRTVNWFVTGQKYVPGSKGSWDLVGRRMETWMLDVLERRQYRRLRLLERNIRILSEHLERSAHAMCKSVDALNKLGMPNIKHNRQDKA